MHTSLSRTLLLVASLATLATASAEPLTFAGPAMGTTYRVRLARPIEGKSLGAVHREVDRLLEKLDHALSTWRDDSDISRLNRAAAGEWVPIHTCLFDVLMIAKRLHQQTGGRFDVTVAPLVHWWAEQERLGAAPDGAAIPPDILQITGMKLISLRGPTATEPAAARKEHAQTAIDLNSIGPGYAVDQIGEDDAVSTAGAAVKPRLDVRLPPGVALVTVVERRGHTVSPGSRAAHAGPLGAREGHRRPLRRAHGPLSGVLSHSQRVAQAALSSLRPRQT